MHPPLPGPKRKPNDEFDHPLCLSQVKGITLTHHIYMQETDRTIEEEEELLLMPKKK
jgi:hypothetical protein